jgi:hypothetical protein
MKKSFFDLAVIFLFVLISCKEKDKSAQIVAQLNPTDTFLFEFPNRKGVFDSTLYKQINYYDSSLGFESLEKGFDSIQIRLWYGGSFTGERIVILSNKNNKWASEISKISYSTNPEYKRKSFDNYWEQSIPLRNIEYRTPKSGWNKFISQLLKLNILTLPQENNIKDFQKISTTDGDGVSVEVALKNVYRYYSYSNPDMYPQYEEMKNVSHILNLIDEEFRLEKLWDYTNQEVPTVVPTVDTTKVKIQEMTIQEVKPVKKKKRK